MPKVMIMIITFEIGSNLIKYWQRISWQLWTMPHYQIVPDGPEISTE